jgi:hypothetical protein
MAFNDAPTTLWPSYTSDGTNITIPIAALDGLTDAEAHTSTGDWRSIMLAICSTAYRHYSELLTADKPTMFIASMPTITPVSSGTLAGTFKTTYSFVFYNEYCVPDVADEPA